MGTVMEEDQTNSGVDEGKQNELWILLPGERKLDFPFSILTVDEALVLASGKQM